MTDLGELTIERFDYIDRDRVQVSLKNNDGNVVTYTTSTSVFMMGLTAAVDLINSRKVEILKDVGMF